MVRRYQREIQVPSIPLPLLREIERVMMREDALALAESKSRVRPVAFTGVMHEGKYIIGLAEQDLPGYMPIFLMTESGPMGSTFPSYDAASEYAADMNAELGISKEQAIRIVLSSMRHDWTVGGALARKRRKE